jgi:hypothetical protein
LHTCLGFFIFEIMKPTTPSKVVFAALTLVAGVSAVHAQSVLVGPVVNTTGTASVNISQTGAGKLGDSGNPVTLSGEGDFSLAVQQIGTSPGQASWVKAYTGTGSEATQITLKQQTADTTPVGVNDVWAKILLGTANPNTAPININLLQQGNGAQALIQIDNAQKDAGSEPEAVTVNWTQAAGATGSFISTAGNNIALNLTQAAGSVAEITNAGSGNVYGTSGTPLLLGALSTLGIVNSGSGNSYAISTAAGSGVSIANTGANNIYNVATQQSGDWLNMATTGSDNAFNFNFNGYKGIDWGVASAASSQKTPVTVSGGVFTTAYTEATGHYVYDAQNNAANQTAAAYATVTSRPQP